MGQKKYNEQHGTLRSETVNGITAATATNGSNATAKTPTTALARKLAFATSGTTNGTTYWVKCLSRRVATLQARINEHEEQLAQMQADKLPAEYIQSALARLQTDERKLLQAQHRLSIWADNRAVPASAASVPSLVAAPEESAVAIPEESAVAILEERRKRELASTAPSSDVKPAVGFEVDPVHSTTVDYESPVDEDEGAAATHATDATDPFLDASLEAMLEDTVRSIYEIPGTEYYSALPGILADREATKLKEERRLAIAERDERVGEQASKFRPYVMDDMMFEEVPRDYKIPEDDPYVDALSDPFVFNGLLRELSFVDKLFAEHDADATDDVPVEYESPEDEDDDDVMDEKVPVDCESPGTTDTPVLKTLNGIRDVYLGEQSTSRGHDNVDVAVDLMLVGNKVDVVVELPSVEDATFSSRKEQVASSRKKTKKKKKFNASLNFGRAKHRGVLVPSTIASSSNSRKTKHPSPLIKEVKYHPPDAPDYAGQLHVRPPDKCAKNYDCCGGSPLFDAGENSTDLRTNYRGVVWSIYLMNIFLIKGGLILVEMHNGARQLGRTMVYFLVERRFWDNFLDMRFEYLSTLFLVRLTDSDQ